MIAPPATRTINLGGPLDLRSTLGPMRFGKGDPTMLLRFDEAFRASRTPQGPATLHLVHRGHQVLAEAWGDGADWALEHLPELLGEDDVTPYLPDDALVRDLAMRTPGLRFGRTHRVFESLVSAVCGQLVSAFEGKRAYRQIVGRLGEPAPGPVQLDLVVPPDPSTVASTAHSDLHPLGLERERADIIRRAGARAATLESISELPHTEAAEAERRLRSIAGVAIWTSAVVREIALGDPDAVRVGDNDLKHIVAFAFRGERHGTDAQMLELLEPFAGQRGRVLRLLRIAGLGPPARNS